MPEQTQDQQDTDHEGETLLERFVEIVANTQDPNVIARHTYVFSKAILARVLAAGTEEIGIDILIALCHALDRSPESSDIVQTMDKIDGFELTASVRKVGTGTSIDVDTSAAVTSAASLLLVVAHVVASTFKLARKVGETKKKTITVQEWMASVCAKADEIIRVQDDGGVFVSDEDPDAFPEK